LVSPARQRRLLTQSSFAHSKPPDPWQGVGCSYNTPSGVKEVLADVWGIAQPGEMQALLGPSGAGKSTFMVRLPPPPRWPPVLFQRLPSAACRAPGLWLVRERGPPPASTWR
jgi:hypothetical protein